MTIEISLSQSGRAESARGRAGSEQALAADAFAGLFASLAAPAPPDVQRQVGGLAQAEPGKHPQTSAQPQLPIWPGLVQGALPAAARDGVRGQPVAAEVAEAAGPAEEAGAAEAAGLPPGLRASQPAAEAVSPRSSRPAPAADEVGGAAMAMAPPDSAPDPAAAPAAGATAQAEAAADQVAPPQHETAPAPVDHAAAGASGPPQGGSATTGSSIPVGMALPASAAAAQQEAGPRAGAQVHPAPRAERGPRQPAGGPPSGPPVSLQLPDTANARALQATAELGPAPADPVQTDRLPPPALEARAAAPMPVIDPGLAGLSTSVAAPGRGADPLVALPMSTPSAPVPASALTEHAVAIIRELGQGRSQARIELHPAELGHLDLELKQDGQKLDISVAVDNEQSRRLVQDQLAQWRERLAESGIALQGLNVALRERDEPPRQDSGAGNERATSADEADVKNPSARVYQDPSRSLDLYA